MPLLDLTCRCGAIHLEIEAEPIAQVYCHCDDCRAAHAAAYVASAVYPAAAVRLVGAKPGVRAVKTTERLHCPAYGTHLLSEIPSAGLRSVNAFLLPAGVFQPTAHVQCHHAVAPIADTLPHYAGFPAAFGGDDSRVDW